MTLETFSVPGFAENAESVKFGVAPSTTLNIDGCLKRLINSYGMITP
jgi:hypothetical protein